MVVQQGNVDGAGRDIATGPRQRVGGTNVVNPVGGRAVGGRILNRQSTQAADRAGDGNVHRAGADGGRVHIGVKAKEALEVGINDAQD